MEEIKKHIDVYTYINSVYTLLDFDHVITFSMYMRSHVHIPDNHADAVKYMHNTYSCKGKANTPGHMKLKKNKGRPAYPAICIFDKGRPAYPANICDLDYLGSSDLY